MRLPWSQLKALLSCSWRRAGPRNSLLLRAVLLVALSAVPAIGSADPTYTLYGVPFYNQNQSNGVLGNGLGPITTADQFCHLMDPQNTPTSTWDYNGPNFTVDIHGTYNGHVTMCTWTWHSYQCNGGTCQWVTYPNYLQNGLQYLEVICPDPAPGAGTYTYAPISSAFCPQHFVSIFPLPQAQCESCLKNPISDPLNPASGAVFQTQADVQTPLGGIIGFRRFYNSTDTGTPDLAVGWRHSFSRTLKPRYQPLTYQRYGVSYSNPPSFYQYSNLYGDAASACTNGFADVKSQMSSWRSATATYANGVCALTVGATSIGTLPIYYASPSLPAAGAMLLGIDAIRDDGQLISFTLSGNSIVAPPSIGFKLQQTSSGYTLTDESDNVETYDLNGKLLSVTSRAGVVQTMGYDGSGRLSTVTDSFGHSLTLSYDGQNHLTSVMTP
jgi:YD repeat-containing protein